MLLRRVCVRSVLCLIVLSVLSLAAAQPIVVRPRIIQARHVIYYTDARESPGSVYKYVSGEPVAIFYSRSRGFLHSILLHWSGSEDKMYFVDANEYPGRIYMAVHTARGWYVQVVYEHHTYIRDLAWGPGTVVGNVSYPDLYFSEATGAGGNGKIYRLTNRGAELYYEVRLEDVDGFWAGHFTFAGDILYLSSGNRVPASIYRVQGDKVYKVYTGNSPICGIHYVPGPTIGKVHHPGFLYFADFRQRIYRVDLLTWNVTTVLFDAQRQWIQDVYVLKG